MTRRLLIISFMAFFSAFLPLSAMASSPDIALAAEQVDDQPEVSLQGQTVYITGAQGSDLIVVSLTGRQLMKVRIESAAQHIELNIPRGCYILKVGKVVRKIQVH